MFAGDPLLRPPPSVWIRPCNLRSLSASLTPVMVKEGGGRRTPHRHTPPHPSFQRVSRALQAGDGLLRPLSVRQDRTW